MNTEYMLKQAQLERAKGELNVLCAMWYDPSREKGGEVYREIKPMVDEFLKELADHCG